MAVHEEKYAAFQELVKYPEQCLHGVDCLKKLESAYLDLTFEIDRNKYQFQNLEIFNEYQKDKLNYVVFAITNLINYSKKNYQDNLKPLDTDNILDLGFNSFIARLNDIGERAIEYRDTLLRLKNKALDTREAVLNKIEQKETSRQPNPESNANHFCKSMPLIVAKDHFKVFTETSSKNKKPFLTAEQFNLFLEKAFHGKNTIEKQTFNYSQREKLYIVKRFYEFYSVAAKEYESNSQCQPKYIKLLTDNFTNWSYESVKNNFGNKVKREW